MASSSIFLDDRSAGVRGKFTQDSIKLLIEHRRMEQVRTLFCSLCDHQAIDAIGREIFHVAVEQARAFSVQHAVAITNDSANSGARSVFTDAPNSCGRIVETTRLGSHLAILDHGDAVYIERIESPGFIKMDIWNGRRVAPQATAVGKALICQLSREEVQEIAGLHALRQVSPRTIVTLPHLFEELAAIRRRGYAIDDEEHAIGVRCVAAPVFSATGEVVAAIGVSGTVSQLNDDYLPSLGKIVQTTALKLSAQLGGRRSR